MTDFLNMIEHSDLTRSVWPGNPDPLIVLFIIVLAFAIGMFIGFVYMWTHEALSYSRTFVGALGMMPLVVAMLMLAMAGNIFVAFGLLGVFGIVRFRNVLKDTRDTIFILWAVMEGVAIGTTRFSTGALGALGIGAGFSACVSSPSAPATLRRRAKLARHGRRDATIADAPPNPQTPRHAP